ncbi:hypothetical protein HY967_04510 [Candidatus Jorgensenbacteria bacterium]|nr:hypothetical protein [Candidatus Jorgensenbacteria bacterium]
MKHQLTAIVLGEVPRAIRGQVFQPQGLKSAPHYFESSVPHQVILDEEKIKIDEQEIAISLRGYPHDILLIQATINIPNIFNEQVFDLEDKMFDACYKILKKRGGNEELSEMYSFFVVSEYTGEPEQFFKHGPIIASLLKSERAALDEKEVEYTLGTQIKYGHNDLAIIDWDGAFIFDPEGDVESTIELITLANLQLLRYRILDRRIDEQLEKMSQFMKEPKQKLSMLFHPKHKEITKHLQEIMRYRMAAITAFQTVERDIKLIGDWYSARLYDLAVKKFKINDWRNSIKEKLESVEDVYHTVTEHFGLSLKDRAEFIQIILFFVLQVGWLVLIVLEFLYFTR